ncbi:hypothetical protein CKO25_20090 [Thiocapsa imhoffii]|uniref:Uncharacterized protein n=1 Tax=Thiocapsa imhoffii TaxID=382777 RepID=A0A9X0WNB5_9GAMM|nr:hypothetical protein [Thiocapsa imhoffii]MBK1646882.1 hypothetical protein [Thiocapsa imhoffii]
MKRISIFLIFFVIIITHPIQSFAYKGTIASGGLKAIAAISKNHNVLPAEEIVKLSKLSQEAGGTRKVGQVLGERNLPNEVLQDTFMRIAIYQNKIPRKEAELMYFRLGNTPGFRTTLRKVIGNSDAGTAGHLNELRIADAASARGFKVLGIGEKFNDGLKRAPTDIDLILKRKEKTFVIEAKDYASKSRLPLDKYRADLETLKAYKKGDDSVVRVFTITNKPNDPRYLKMLQHEADSRGVQLIIGKPAEQIEQIKILGEIL